MVEEFKEEEYEQPITNYEDLVSEEAERDVGLDEIGMPRTLAEAEEGTEQKTDLQVAMRALLPKFRDRKRNDLLQSAMVSRIFPDNFIDRHFVTVACLIEELEAEEDIPFIEILTEVQDALLIGYEGRGRIDILEIAGVAHEEELEKLSKDLGL